jgi:hypothetical protein
MPKHLFIGGMIAAGFDPAGKYLLAVSHSGRGVFSTATWEKVARDATPAYPENGHTQGIGPLAGVAVSVREIDYDTEKLEFSSTDGRFVCKYEEGLCTITEMGPDLPPFETIHTVEGYYDGPRFGVTDFNGQPHYYCNLHWDTSNWHPDESRFELSPVPPQVLAATCEAAAIFKRWDTMRQATPVFTYTDEEFGALPEDLPRYRELKQLLESSYASAIRTRRVLVCGEFRVCRDSPSRMEARWKLAE